MVVQLARFLFILIALAGCKGHREFKEARKELKAARAAKETMITDSAGVVTPADPTDLLFSMKRGYCFGACPVFELRLYENGSATYSGTANVSRIGNYSAVFTSALRDSILNATENIDFVMLLDSYDNQFITDLPATNYTLSVDDRQKNIVCRFGCPESLIEFGQKVELWIETVEWVNSGN